MITAIRKTPATAVGVIPSERAKALRRIGSSVSVKMSTLVEGDVLMLPTGAHVLVRAQYDVRRNGRRVLLRELENSFVHTMPYDPNAWVPVLRLPEKTDLRLGNIVLYPGKGSHDSVAAIRHHFGWMRTAAPWMPLSDVEVVLHLHEERAQLIRTALGQGARRRRRPPVGSVVACRNLDAPEPTVWIKTAPDFWVGSNRGVTASDLMINYELGRRTYHVVWTPEVNG